MKLPYKLIIFISFIFLTILVSSHIAVAEEFHVYSGLSIQNVINEANKGDLIVVHSGKYAENLNIDKELTLVSETGNYEDTIITAKNANKPVIFVNSSNVLINGFKLKGSQSKSAIVLNSANACTISNNLVSENKFGIRLTGHSESNDLHDNIVASNKDHGIYLASCCNNTVHNNLISNCKGSGLRLDGSDNNTISDNILKNNVEGIVLWHSSNNTITGNNEKEALQGIVLIESEDNIIKNTTIFKNIIGITLSSSNHNIISYNTIKSNNLYGLHISDSKNNYINQNGIFNNIESIYDLSKNKNYFQSNEEKWIISRILFLVLCLSIYLVISWIFLVLCNILKEIPWVNSLNSKLKSLPKYGLISAVLLTFIDHLEQIKQLIESISEFTHNVFSIISPHDIEQELLNLRFFSDPYNFAIVELLLVLLFNDLLANTVKIYKNDGEHFKNSISLSSLSFNQSRFQLTSISLIYSLEILLIYEIVLLKLNQNSFIDFMLPLIIASVIIIEIFLIFLIADFVNFFYIWLLLSPFVIAWTLLFFGSISIINLVIIWFIYTSTIFVQIYIRTRTIFFGKSIIYNIKNKQKNRTFDT